LPTHQNDASFLPHVCTGTGDQHPKDGGLLHHGNEQYRSSFPSFSQCVLSSVPEHDIVSQATALQKEYSCDLSDAFPVELVTLASSFKSEIAQLSSVKDLAHLLIVENAALTSTVTEVVSALLLFLTLPATDATAEQSFSKLRLIKNDLRTTMGQDRLCALTLLNIEAESAE